ncbi:MAG: SAM-dependent methyltransferase [Cognatishimia sp.]
MNRVINLQRGPAADPIEPGKLDYTMFSTPDFVNIILQRSDVLKGVKDPGKLISQWSSGENRELQEIAEAQNVQLAQRAMVDICEEFDELAAHLAQSPPKSIADIGCGYAFFDLAAGRQFNADVHLIDLENNDLRHFGFNEAGSAYSDLKTAVKFLTKNGLKKSRVTATNPELTDVSTLPQVDLAVSFLACGFHFPVDTYMTFFKENVAPGGRIILDIRKAKKNTQIELLETLGDITILSEQGNRLRVLVQKPKAEKALTELSKSDWNAHLTDLGTREGFFEELGDQHSALFIDKGDTLIVTFENLDHVYDFTEDRMPWGHRFVTGRGWSMLGMMAHDWTWYRDEAVFDFFDRLRDEGFFDRFKKIVFYGASMGGYAAAAFSAAAPGSTVILISPQATLDREIAPWEHRYLKAWRRSFDTRYGYAPDMVKTADKVFLFFDPRMPQDAMHATLFQGDNIHRYRCRFFGHRMASLWGKMGVLKDVIDSCLDGSLRPAKFYALMRKRRDTARYLREFLDTLEKSEKPQRVAIFCKAVLARRRGPKFRQALNAADAKMAGRKGR